MDQSFSSSSSPSSSSALIFLGTGCSSGLPSARCLLNPTDPPCRVCSQSLLFSPEVNPNYRCNTSLLIDYGDASGMHNYILIDVGKTFREQLLRWFTHHKIPRVDSIILTHEHADAVLGLDHVQAVQQCASNHVHPTPVYLNKDTMSSIALKLSYLMRKEGQDEGDLPLLDWRIIQNDCRTSFLASGLQFVPLPVMHGEDYVSLGFLFGKNCRVAYISDVSHFPPSTEFVISRNGAGQVDLLILDANTTRLITTRSTHLCLPQTLDAVKRICPKRALLVGMNHDFDHESCNMYLADWSRREGIPVQLAHDGLRIPVDL